MVFKTLGTSLSNFINKSWTDTVKDFKISGISSLIKDSDTIALNNFARALQNGQTRTKAFRSTLSEASLAAKKQAVEIAKLNTQYKSGAINSKTYSTQLKTLGVETEKVSLKTKLATAGFQMLKVALSTIAFTIIISLITNLVNKQKELAEQAKESADEVNNQVKALEDLKKKYIEIVDSTDDEKTKNEQLNEIKQELIDTYKIEKDNLADLNLEREEGIKLLEEEIKLAKVKQQRDWLEDNKKAINNAKNKLEYNQSFNNDGYTYADGFDYWTGKDNSISDEIKNLFDRVEKIDDLTVDFKINTSNAIEEYERLDSIATQIRNISLKRDLTESEQLLFDDISSQVNYLRNFLKDNADLVDVYNQSIASQAIINLEDYKITDESYKNLGKENYLAWRDGLLATADGDKQLENELLALAEKQFPDYAEYFNNLDLAKSMFGVGSNINNGFDAGKKKFLEELSDEDLEIAIQIPDLFIDGIENATEKIENFKKVNNFDKSIKSLEELKEAYDGISDSADKFISNQKTVNSAFEEQEKYGQLASSTVSSLIEAGYSRALSVNAETGAITLNKDAVDMLNSVKKQELKLSIMREKLSLQEKLRDESVEINSLTAEMAHATEERREEIRTLIAERMAQAALNDEAVEMLKQYDAILGMIENPIEFDDDKKSTDKKSTKDEEPAQVTAFKKELAKKQHLVTMKKLSEEEYLNWLDGAYKTAYAGLEGYEDDLYKYEEEIFSKRRELAEKAFDDTIDGIEKEIDALEKLKDNASLDIDTEGSIYSIIDQQILLYQQAIAEIDKRIAELEASGLVGIEDEIEELNKQRDDLLEKVYDLGKERTSTGIENEISYWEEMQSKQNDFYDKQIEKLKKQKELLEDKNDEEERAKDLAEKQLELRKAQIALEDAQKNRTVLKYYAGGGLSYETDKTAIAEAEEDVRKAKEDLAKTEKDILKDGIDKQIDILEEQKDKDSEYYDTVVKLLEDMSGKNKVQSESNRSIWGQLLATDAGQKALAQVNNSTLQELLDTGFLAKKDGRYVLGEGDLTTIRKTDKDITKMLSKLLHIPESSIIDSEKLLRAVSSGSGFNSLTMPNQSMLSELTKVNSTAVTNYNNSKISNNYRVDKIEIGYSGDDFNDMLGQAFNAMNQQITINGNKVAYGN